MIEAYLYRYSEDFQQSIRDTGEGDPHMYYAYSALVGWIVIANGWYGSNPQSVTLQMISDEIWTQLFRDLVCQALVASAVALFILAFLFPSFASDYLRKQLGHILDYFTTWFSIVNVVDPNQKLTENHRKALFALARQSDFIFCNIQRNMSKSLSVEMWFQKKWEEAFFKNDMKKEKYHYDTKSHLKALQIARRVWISLWELSPEVGPVERYLALPLPSNYHPHKELDDDIIAALSMLAKAYYGAPYVSQYGFALPARLAHSLRGPKKPRDYSKIFGAETSNVEGLVLEGSITRLVDALYDWLSLINETYTSAGDIWPCLNPIENASNEDSNDIEVGSR